MTYSNYERDLAKEFIQENELFSDPTDQLAQLLADVRRDALEEAAQVAEQAMMHKGTRHMPDIATRIRALKEQ